MYTYTGLSKQEMEYRNSGKYTRYDEDELFWMWMKFRHDRCAARMLSDFAGCEPSEGRKLHKAFKQRLAKEMEERKKNGLL